MGSAGPAALGGMDPISHSNLRAAGSRRQHLVAWPPSLSTRHTCSSHTQPAAAHTHSRPLLTHSARRRSHTQPAASHHSLCADLSSVEIATILKGGLNKRSIVPAGKLRTELGQTPLKSQKQRQLSAPPPTAMVTCGLGLSSTYIITFMILGAP